MPQKRINEKERLRLEYIDPSTLDANPQNWRRHPPSQRTAMSEMLESLGWAAPVVFNEETGRLIDGHMRVELARERGEETIPVCVGRWSEDEEKALLSLYDPLGDMSAFDLEAYGELVGELSESEYTTPDMLFRVQEAVMNGESSVIPSVDAESRERKEQASGSPQNIPEGYQVLVICDDEDSQATLLEELTNRGYDCRSLIS